MVTVVRGARSDLLLCVVAFFPEPGVLRSDLACCISCRGRLTIVSSLLLCRGSHRMKRSRLHKDFMGVHREFNSDYVQGWKKAKEPFRMKGIMRSKSPFGNRKKS